MARRARKNMAASSAYQIAQNVSGAVPGRASQTPSPMQAPAVPQPSDQQLQRFASASQKVSGVVDEYRPKVESAKTDEAKQKLVKEADEKMVQCADGLTVDEFNGISRAVQQDPQLQQRVSKLNPSGKTR